MTVRPMDESCRIHIDPVFNDLDGDGFPEFVTQRASYSWASDDTVMFEPPPMGWRDLSADVGSRAQCNVFTLDLDGTAPGQVLLGNRILNGNGRERCAIPADDGMAWPADFDGNGTLDILLVNADEIVLANTDCEVLARRSTRAAFGTDGDVFPRGWIAASQASVAPILDRVGADLIWTYVVDGRVLLAVVDGDLDVHIMASPGGGYNDSFGAVADLDGDGLFEYFLDDDLIDPRTGAVLGSLGLPHGGWAQVVADIDGDSRAEVVALACSDEACGFDVEIVAFEGDDLARAPVNFSWRDGDRPWLENPDGTVVPAGQYPGPELFNSVNVPDYDARWTGEGVQLEAAFAHVCTDSCWKYELPVYVTLANHGVTDLVHPVEIALYGTLRGTEEVLDSIVVPSLSGGMQTQALRMEIEPAWTRATDLRLEVRTMNGRILDTCDGILPTVTFEGRTCADGG